MTDISPLVLVANAADGSISSFRFADERLDHLTTTEGLTGCSTFAVDSARNLVYAGVKGEPAGIVTLELDRRTGVLTPRSRRDLPGGGMNYLDLTRAGTGLLGAGYGGGYGISCTVDEGTVSEPVSRIDYPQLHSVRASADGRFAYFVSLGADLIAQYALDERMSLRSLDAPTAAAPAGSGPRHLVIDDQHGAVYVMTEFSAEVLHYHRDLTGGLSFVGATAAFDPAAELGHSRLGADPLEHHLRWGADLHRAGDHLWASERTESTLGVLAIRDDGTLSQAKGFTVTEPQPRGFAIDAGGRYLVAAGEKSRTVSLYRIAGERLHLLQQTQTGRGANWVRFV